MSKTWFISDLHLDARHPHLLSLFKSFIQSFPSDVNKLYILGDLFEYWLGDDVLDTPVGESLQPVLSALQQLSNRGVELYFIHGNRDFLIGERFASEAGCILLPEYAVIDVFGKRVLILHGDTLCTDDVEYQKFRVLSRDVAWQGRVLSMTIPERVEMAKSLREISSQSTKMLSSEIMDVNGQAVIDMLLKYDVDVMIHGHTHRPAIHEVQHEGKTFQRIVLGDWQKSSSILEMSESGISLSDGR